MKHEGGVPMMLTKQESAILQYIVDHFDEMNRDRIHGELKKIVDAANGGSTHA